MRDDTTGNRRPGTGRLLRIAAVISILALAGFLADRVYRNDPTAPAEVVAAKDLDISTSLTATSDTSVGVVYDSAGLGDHAFNDAANLGLSRAATDLGIKASDLELVEAGDGPALLLQQLADSGNDLVFAVGPIFDKPIAAMAHDYPSTNFAIIDGSSVDATLLSNVTSLHFQVEQGAYLVGAAAGWKSTTARVAFLGADESNLARRHEAGFVAGARQVNPSIAIDVVYLQAQPGANTPAPGTVSRAALELYENGADIIYHPRIASGPEVFEAAREFSRGRGVNEDNEVDLIDKVWAIGTEFDQYAISDPQVADFVLTSMIKRVDVAVYNTVRALEEGRLTAGHQTLDLAVDGVGYSTSGGFIDDIVTDLELLKDQILSGEIDVPTSMDP